MEFQEQAHINFIRKYLWCDREYGRAAVMVGAGFSRNAEKVSSTVQSLPTWVDLCRLLYSELYKGDQFEIKSFSSAEVLRLANEYEAYFGRPALDKFIQDTIPDKSFSPGRLHQLILDLPWSDVFTTNYDTLLERTRINVRERKYDLIMTPEDIPGKMKPRIVKLHGSFPATRPFITTEEDYRTYPNEFSPFVNMVQQSIMENIFCLIGFSGDDPNFLAWTGWVRDNLGKSTPNIYLCGILNLSSSQKKILESRNIIPIDLTPLFPIVPGVDDETRHSQATEWFLENLKQGKPPQSKDWPSPPKSPVPKSPDPKLPPIPIHEHPTWELGDMHPMHDPGVPVNPNVLISLLSKWENQRMNYPGWVVVPYKNRYPLWHYTEHWIWELINSLELLPAQNQLSLLFELNWRLDKSLMPLFPFLEDKVEKVIFSFNPFPDGLDLNTAIYTPETNTDFDWNKIRVRWVDLVFALLKASRETFKKDEYEKYRAIIDKVQTFNSTWRLRYYYELSLFYLASFDWSSLESTLKEWPQIEDQPYFETKKAGLLAEIFHLEEAEKIAQEALRNIRARLNHGNVDYSLLSQESWTMYLLHGIKLNDSHQTSNELEEYRDRWEKLKQYDCDPFAEMEKIESEVVQLKTKELPHKEVLNKFDPGSRSITIRLSSGSNILKFQSAFSAFCIFEETGIPFRCGFVTMSKELIIGSVDRLIYFNYAMAMGGIIREVEKDTLDKWFDRSIVAGLNEEVVKSQYAISLNALNYLVKTYSENKHGIWNSRSQYIVFFLELISRLCFRLTSKQKDDVFLMAVDLFINTNFNHDISIIEARNKLFKRLFYALEPMSLVKKIDLLLSLPIPTVDGFNVKYIHEWNDPFQFIDWPNGFEIDETFDRETWKSKVNKLIDVVLKGSAEARILATSRLIKIEWIKGLDVDEKKSFINALWKRIDPSTGLPADTLFVKYSFINLSDIHLHKSVVAIKKYVLNLGRALSKYSLEAKVTNEPRVVVFTNGGTRYKDFIQELIYLERFDAIDKLNVFEWTKDEIIELLEIIYNCWEYEKKSFEGDTRDHDDILKTEFSRIVDIISVTILPRLKGLPSKYEELAMKVLNEMEAHGFSLFITLSSKLLLEPTLFENVVSKLRKGINSYVRDEVHDSLESVYVWLVNSKNYGLPLPPKDLIEEIFNKVAFRKMPMLDYALEITTKIVRNSPKIFDSKDEERILVGLEYLITELRIPIGILDLMENENVLINIKDRPMYREKCSKLVFAMYEKYLGENRKIPKVIEDWKSECINDVLPEVSRVWKTV